MEFVTLPVPPITLLLMGWQKGKFKHPRNSLGNHLFKISADTEFSCPFSILNHSTLNYRGYTAELLLRWRPRSILDLALPSVSSWVIANQEKQKFPPNRNAKAQSFAVGDCVYIRDFPSRKLWVRGKVGSLCGPLTYWIELTKWWWVWQHVDHILHHQTTDSENDSTLLCLDLPHLPSPLINPTLESSTTYYSLRRSSQISHPSDRYGSWVDNRLV